MVIHMTVRDSRPLIKCMLQRDSSTQTKFRDKLRIVFERAASRQCESNLNLFLMVKPLIQILIFYNKDIYTARNIECFAKTHDSHFITF